ncbi:MAG: peptide antibiotic transporter SbmA [Rhizobiales bacterium]|nr:peptide antibiotic transporter SbmA [Hyphomicrobiales bacterium]
MFRSFFPMPKIFFPAALAWIIFVTIIWFWIGNDIASFVGLAIEETDEPIIGLGFFLTKKFIWFYIYYILSTLIFSLFWFKFAPHPWQYWSILGSSLIIFSTYFGVQVMVAINNWRRPFFDSIQDALGGEAQVLSSDLYYLMIVFAQIAFVSLAVFVLTRFFVSHYIFRWRTAMNFYYTGQWQKLRTIEGAAQRVQEDTMRFAAIMEGLGVSIIDSVMTLIAFLPVLLSLSEYVTILPLIGEIPAPLVNAAIFWSIFGTIFLAIVGIKLPGLEFRNQRVEASLRKELVYGEDDANRATPQSIGELFNNVRKNYFRLYFHYLYFNVARSFYLQADNIFSYLILIPTIVAGKITFGILQQILTAFGQVSNSFQYIVNAWPTIIELISIFKRLQAFESTLSGKNLSKIEFSKDEQQKEY